MRREQNSYELREASFENQTYQARRVPVVLFATRNSLLANARIRASSGVIRCAHPLGAALRALLRCATFLQRHRSYVFTRRNCLWPRKKSRLYARIAERIFPNGRGSARHVMPGIPCRNLSTTPPRHRPKGRAAAAVFPVPYTHLTLLTINSVYVPVVALALQHYNPPHLV